MEDQEKQLNEIKLDIAQSLAIFIDRIARKHDASDPELMAMTRAAAAVPCLRLDRL